VEAIREDLQLAGTTSNAPLHLADAAPQNIESDIQIVENERDVLEQVQAAIHRLDEGTFGTCERFQRPIGEDRLQAIPYASHCIDCAQEAATSHKGQAMKLTGFEAIEFAEKEGLSLSKQADAIDNAAHNLTVAEAEAIAVENPELIWLVVPDEEASAKAATWNLKDTRLWRKGK